MAFKIKFKFSVGSTKPPVATAICRSLPSCLKPTPILAPARQMPRTLSSHSTVCCHWSFYPEV